LLNIAVKQKKPLEEIKSLQEKIKEYEKMLGDEGRILVRYSGTENKCRVMVEGKDKKEIKSIADTLANIIESEAGLN